MNIFHYNTEKHVENYAENQEDILYDLSYDDLDDFVRSCGINLPITGGGELGGSIHRRAASGRKSK